MSIKVQETYEYNDPRYWEDVELAVTLKNWSDSYSRGKSFNIYNDLTKMVRRGVMTGELSDLEYLATVGAHVKIRDLTPLRVRVLQQFLDIYQKPENNSDVYQAE